MKTKIIVISMGVVFACGMQAKKNQSLLFSARTTLANSQSPFSSVCPELVAGFRNDRTYARNDIAPKAFQVVFFGGSSTHRSESDLAAYFFPYGKQCLSVADDDLLNNFDKKKDLLAQNFNVFTQTGDYASTISIAPKQRVVGCGVHWRQSLAKNPLTGSGVWVSASTALVQVKNNMHLQEYVSNNGGGVIDNRGFPAVATMKEAFVQQSWRFGKISGCAMKKIGLADIELKVGYDQYRQDDSCELYVGLIVPTGNKNKGVYVFEPIVGRGRHAGIMIGGAFDKDLWYGNKHDYTLSWHLANHGEYLFKNSQVRPFDLVDNPWSRYMPLYANKQQAEYAASLALSDRALANNLSTPGINILTRDVSVKYGFAGDCNSAFVLKNPIGRVEGGYNLFVRSAERVALKCPWDPVVAIKYTDGLGRTNPIRTINGDKYLEQEIFNNAGTLLIPVPLAGYDQAVIEQKDVDLSSAATPSLLVHTLYIAGGVHYDDRTYPLIIDGGFSYSLSQNNAVINKWACWIKTGFSF